MKRIDFVKWIISYRQSQQKDIGKWRMRMNEIEEQYELTEWGCLYGVLTEYGIDVSHITARVGAHIVEDFMDALCKAGYVVKKENENEC